jgi:glycosyltransferase involved in cell wall biosynthesis
MVAEKSIHVPTAHDDAAIHLEIFRSLFHLPRFIAFNTDKERQLVHGMFQNEYIQSATVWIGVEIQPTSNSHENYLLYMGRVENGKNCQELFEYVHDSGVHLEVIGNAQIPIPRHVEYLGFVSEAEKQHILARCRALVLPSRNESLSLATLDCPVLKGHVEKSGGGYTYRDADEFRKVVNNVDPARGLAGRNYVEQNYSWTRVLNKYDDVFSLLAGSETPSSVTGSR